MRHIAFGMAVFLCAAGGAQAQGVKDRIAGGGAPAAPAQQDYFGDDTSSWAFDGECDDPRFTGPGAADTLLDADLGHDATDCRDLWNAGQITLAGTTQAAVTAPAPSQAMPGYPADWAYHIGDDSGDSAFDFICDDPRFEGPDVRGVTPRNDMLGRDAYDCELSYYSGYITFRPGTQVQLIDFGDDSGPSPFDTICNDPRFEGSDVSNISDAATARDATDCSDAWELETAMVNAAAAASLRYVPAETVSAYAPDFGDDTSEWAFDGVCDDNRFGGETATQLSDAHVGHDATDCRDDWNSGEVMWLYDWSLVNGTFQ